MGLTIQEVKESFTNIWACLHEKRLVINLLDDKAPPTTRNSNKIAVRLNGFAILKQETAGLVGV